MPPVVMRTMVSLKMLVTQRRRSGPTVMPCGPSMAGSAKGVIVPVTLARTTPSLARELTTASRPGWSMSVFITPSGVVGRYMNANLQGLTDSPATPPAGASMVARRVRAVRGLRAPRLRGMRSPFS